MGGRIGVTIITMLTLVVLSGAILPIGKAAGSEMPLFSDDFESYSVDTFPSANWEIVWDGTGENYVTDAYSFSPTKSLQLWGQPNWSSVAQRKFSTDAPVIGYECAIRIDSIGTGGPGREEAVGFFNRDVYIWGRGYAVVLFNHDDGQIKAEDGTALGDWEPGVWCQVKVILDRRANTYDVWIDEELRAEGLSTTHSDTELIDALSLMSDHAGVKVYYDDVKVWEVDAWKASNPYPANGATDVSPNVILSWEPPYGYTSPTFDVYLGTNFDAVYNAKTSDPEYLGNVNSNQYDPSGPLDLGETYYWRADTVVPLSRHKGNVWDFTTTPAAETPVFYQMDFNLSETIYTDTEWGSVDFTFTGQEPIMYFNLAVNGTWQVQNIPVLSIEGVGVEQTMTYFFDLGTQRGVDVTSLSYDYAFTPDILDVMPDGSTSATVVDGHVAMWPGFGDFMPALAPAKPLIGGEVVNSDEKYAHKDFPNQECELNECTPTAVSNSLQFLNKKHGLGMDPNKISIDEMKKAVGWDPNGAPSDWWRIKKTYMEDNDYPITTRKITDINELVAEIRAGQDVEIDETWRELIDPNGDPNDPNNIRIAGHTTALIGITPLKNGKYSLDVADDRKQGETGGCDNPRTYIYDPNDPNSTFCEIDPNDPNGTFYTNFDYAVVECPKVEKPSGAPEWWENTEPGDDYAFAKWAEPPGSHYPANPPNDATHWHSNFLDSNDFKIDVDGSDVTVTLGNKYAFLRAKNVYFYVIGKSPGTSGEPTNIEVSVIPKDSEVFPDINWAVAHGEKWALSIKVFIRPQPKKVIIKFTIPKGWTIEKAWAGEVCRGRDPKGKDVDDFEAYNDHVNRVFETWKDGYGYGDVELGYPGNDTGSRVRLNIDPNYGGEKSMIFDYDNTGTAENIFGDPITAYYSEAERTFDSPQDWTRDGVKALSLWFYGDPNNNAEQMYVAMEDNMGMTKLVNHPNPNATLLDTWQEWNIDLREFSDASVDLTNVSKMYIGIGDRHNPQPGGTGTLYFDDIRLYPPRCVPELRKPVADFSGDCVVDFSDLEVMARDWLSIGGEVETDLFEDNKLDFKDYAVLAETWLEGPTLWP
ncbi:MAG: hypothetical protein ACYTFW_04025 [Planctomycetota bacterium]